MAEFGRKVYFDKATGTVIVETGERSGDVINTTIEQDFQIFASLAERTPSSVGVIQLSFGELRDEFMMATSYKVNLVTGNIDFTYEPGNPGPQPTQDQIRITELEAENLILKNRVSDVEMFIADIISGGV